MDHTESLYKNSKIDWLIKNNQEYHSLLSGGSMNDNVFIYEQFYIHTEDLQNNPEFAYDKSDHILDCRRQMLQANGVHCDKEEINLSTPLSRYVPTVPYAYLTMEHINKSTYINPNVILYNSPNDCSINSILNEKGELRYHFGYIDGSFKYEEPMASRCLKTFAGFPTLCYKMELKNISGFIDMSEMKNISIFISLTFDSCDLSNCELILPDLPPYTELIMCNCTLTEEQYKGIKLASALQRFTFTDIKNNII